MKKKISCTFFILVIGVLIVPLFFSTSVSAETTATKVGWYSRSITYVYNQDDRSYKYSGSIVILTNDENAYGTITITNTEYHYSSKYTEIPISGTVYNLSNVPTSVSGTFTPGDSGLDVVQLNPVQLQALLDVIRESAGSDLSTIETTLDLIKTTLISINVNTENQDGESYLRLINELLDEQLPLYKTILTNIQNNTSNIYTQLSNIRSQLASIVIYTNQLNNKFPSSYGNSVLTKLDTLDATCNAIITAINTDFEHLENNIDRLIDNISWVNIPTSFYSSTDNSNYNDIVNQIYYGGIYIRTGNINIQNNMLSHLYRLKLKINSSYDDIKFYFSNGTDVTNNYFIYHTKDRQYVYIYFISISNIGYYGSSTNITIYLNNHNYTYTGDDWSLDYIDNNDIEYWQLLYYMKSFDYYNKMLKEDVTTNNLGNINSQLQQNSQEMFNQEEAFNNNLNSSLGDITLPDNPFNNFGTMFGQSSRFLVYMFDQMTTTRGSPFGTVITFSLLLGLALLMIGKKGR